MSYSITPVSDQLYYKITPPIFDANPKEGKSGILFYVGDRLIHEEIIRVSRSEMETKSLYTVTGRVSKFILKGTFEITSTEVLDGTNQFDVEQIQRAKEIALKKLNLA